MIRRVTMLAAIIILCVSSPRLFAPARSAPRNAALQPDNSRQNALHRAVPQTAPQTADDQPNDRADRLTAARVRRAIVADDSLSIYAHNVKIIVAAGKVTLEGPVHSGRERQQIAFDTASVVDPRAIVNRITVA